MMADMIATLVNQTSHLLLTPPPLDESSGDTRQQLDQPDETSNGNDYKAADGESSPGSSLPDSKDVSARVPGISTEIERNDSRKISALGYVFPHHSEHPSADFAR